MRRRNPAEANWPPKRIVSYYARPSDFNTGGVNTSRSEWCEEFAARIAPVLMISARGGYVPQPRPGVKSVGIRHLGRSRMTLLPLGLARRLRRDDMVILHEGWTPSNLLASIVLRWKRVPYVVMPHGVYDPHIASTIKLRRLRTWAESFVLGGALAVHVFFETEIPYVRAISPHARTIVAMTGMHPRTSLAWEGGSGHLGWLGRYDIHHKGLDRLLGALSLIDPEHRPRIVMHGPDHLGDRARFRDQVRAAGLDKWVTANDELAGDERWTFYEQCSAVVHPARWEAFGRSIVEALQMGVPVLVSDSVEIAVSLGDAEAALVTSTTPSDFAESLRDLGSSTVRTKLSRNALAWSEQHLDWSHVCDGYEAQLQGVWRDQNG